MGRSSGLFTMLRVKRQLSCMVKEIVLQRLCAVDVQKYSKRSENCGQNHEKYGLLSDVIPQNLGQYSISAMMTGVGVLVSF